MQDKIEASMTLQEENAELQGLVGSLEAQLKLAQAHLAEEQVCNVLRVCLDSRN